MRTRFAKLRVINSARRALAVGVSAAVVLLGSVTLIQSTAVAAGDTPETVTLEPLRSDTTFNDRTADRATVSNEIGNPFSFPTGVAGTTAPRGNVTWHDMQSVQAAPEGMPGGNRTLRVRFGYGGGGQGGGTDTEGNAINRNHAILDNDGGTLSLTTDGGAANVATTDNEDKVVTSSSFRLGDIDSRVSTFDFQLFDSVGTRITDEADVTWQSTTAPGVADTSTLTVTDGVFRVRTVVTVPGSPDPLPNEFNASAAITFSLNNSKLLGNVVVQARNDTESPELTTTWLADFLHADFTRVVNEFFPNVSLSKAVSSGPTANAKGNYDIEYTITARNVGDTVLQNIVVTDDLDKAFGEDLVGTSTTTNNCDDGVTLAAPTNAEGSDGGTCTAVVNVEVKAPGEKKEHNNVANVTAESPGGKETTADANAKVTLDPLVPNLVVSKALTKVNDNPVGPGVAVAADDTVTYGLTFTNHGPGPATGIDYTDVLAGILDDATVDYGTLTPTTGTLTAAQDGENARVTGSLAARASVTVTFDATVKADDLRGDNTLSNVLAPTGHTADCEVNPELCTENRVPLLAIEKSVVEVVDVDEDALTNEGDTIQWGFTVTNTGAVTLTNVRVDDPLLAELGIGITCDANTLAPDEATDCRADSVYVITAADDATGIVRNVATAIGTPPPGTNGSTPPDVVSPPDETETPTRGLPMLFTSFHVSPPPSTPGVPATTPGVPATTPGVPAITPDVPAITPGVPSLAMTGGQIGFGVLGFVLLLLVSGGLLLRARRLKEDGS